MPPFMDPVDAVALIPGRVRERIRRAGPEEVPVGLPVGRNTLDARLRAAYPFAPEEGFSESASTAPSVAFASSAVPSAATAVLVDHFHASRQRSSQSLWTASLRF